jgi:hypothetical protein
VSKRENGKGRLIFSVFQRKCSKMATINKIGIFFKRINFSISKIHLSFSKL